MVTSRLPAVPMPSHGKDGVGHEIAREGAETPWRRNVASSDGGELGRLPFSDVARLSSDATQPAVGVLVVSRHTGRAEALEAQVDLRARPTDGVVAAATAGVGIAILRSDGGEIARVADRTEDLVGSVTWAADGTFLLASSPGGATVWASDGWEAVRSLETGPGSMLPAALSADGSRIALGWDHHVGPLER